MDLIRLEYSCFSKNAKLFINNEPISSYSELATCVGTPLHICAERFLILLDEEMYSDYEIQVKGVYFQYVLLLECIKKSQFCKKVTFEPVEYKIGTITDIAREFSTLNDKYGLGAISHKVIQVCDKTGTISDYQLEHYESADSDMNYDLLISNEIEDDAACRTVLHIGDYTGIENRKGHTHVFIKREQFKVFWEYFEFTVLYIAQFEAFIENAQYLDMLPQDHMKLQAYITNQPQCYWMKEDYAIEVGRKKTIMFEVFPESAKNQYFFTSSDTAICEINGNEIIAHKEGNAIIQLYNETKELLGSQAVTVIKHIYITSLSLKPNFTCLRKDETGIIQVHVLPENSEDIQTLQWQSSNPDIVRIEQDGTVRGLQFGTSVITVRSERVQAALTVEVRPLPEQMVIRPKKGFAKLGKKQMIYCDIYPENAIKGEIVWELDNPNIGTLEVSEDTQSCTFWADKSAIGTGNIRCHMKYRDLKGLCPIKVSINGQYTWIWVLVITVILLMMALLTPAVVTYVEKNRSYSTSGMSDRERLEQYQEINSILQNSIEESKDME